MSNAENHLRSVNEGIAKAYDTVPYDTPLSPAADPARVLGVAAVYGATPAFGDVLDIGCGSGQRLERIASQTDGALVGVDIGVVGLEQARLRLAPWKDRVKLVAADLLDVMPGDLGQFDLIYCTGLLSVAPTEVSIRTLKLIAACLKPGGVAVISYYAGPMAAVRATLFRLLRAGVDGSASPEIKVAVARKRLNQVAEFAAGAPAEATLMDAVRFAQNLSDTNLFHEALNAASEQINTGDVEAELAGQGVVYLGYAEHGLAAGLSHERAWAADFLDLVNSPLRHAVFAKIADGPADLRSPDVRWTTVLRREAGQAGYTGIASYRAGDGAALEIPSILTQAALDQLAEAPLSLNDLAAKAADRAALAGAPHDPEGETRLEQNLLGLWRNGLVQPERVKG